MSLEELYYVNLKRTKDAANRSLPTTPYDFRPTTVAYRSRAAEVNSLTISIPGREDWVFTGGLAKPSIAGRMAGYMNDASDRFDGYDPRMKVPAMKRVV